MLLPRIVSTKKQYFNGFQTKKLTLPTNKYIVVAVKLMYSWAETSTHYFCAKNANIFNLFH